MVVIEAKIPIVALPAQFQYESSSSSCWNCGSDRKSPIRAIALPQRLLSVVADDDSMNHQENTDREAMRNRSCHMPVQLQDVMTVDRYIEFVNQLNERIRRYDIAGRHRCRYEIYYKLFQSTSASTLLAGLSLVGKYLQRFTLSWGDDDDAFLTLLYQFLYYFFGSLFVVFTLFGLISLYHRMFNPQMMKYISIQNTAYANMQQECADLSKHISTTTMNITFSLGCKDPKNRQKKYYDWNARNFVFTSIFDHIIVTITTLSLDTTQPPVVDTISNHHHDTPLRVADVV
jgi:hypothetical protein